MSRTFAILAIATYAPLAVLAAALGLLARRNKHADELGGGA